jgi:hypothetical protein
MVILANVGLGKVRNSSVWIQVARGALCRFDSFDICNDWSALIDASEARRRGLLTIDTKTTRNKVPVSSRLAQVTLRPLLPSELLIFAYDTLAYISDLRDSPYHSTRYTHSARPQD